MADIVTNLLSYQDYLALTEQTSDDVSETSIAILTMQQLVTYRLSCLGISDITTISSDGLSVLKSWTVLYITDKLSNQVQIKADANTDSVLTEIDDGFVKEVFAESIRGSNKVEVSQSHLDDTWKLFTDLVVVLTGLEVTANGLGVAKRVSTPICINLTQNTN